MSWIRLQEAVANILSHSLQILSAEKLNIYDLLICNFSFSFTSKIEVSFLGHCKTLETRDEGCW